MSLNRAAFSAGAIPQSVFLWLLTQLYWQKAMCACVIYIHYIYISAYFKHLGYFFISECFFFPLVFLLWGMSGKGGRDRSTRHTFALNHWFLKRFPLPQTIGWKSLQSFALQEVWVLGQISGVHPNLLSIEFSLLNIDTVVWLTGRHLNLQVILVLYYIFLDGAVFNLLLKQLRHLKLSCQAMTAFRETVFPLVRNRLLEPKCTSWEVHKVCSLGWGEMLPRKGYTSVESTG